MTTHDSTRSVERDLAHRLSGRTRDRLRAQGHLEVVLSVLEHLPFSGNPTIVGNFVCAVLKRGDVGAGPLDGRELYFAIACTHGDRLALREWETNYLQLAQAAVRSVGCDSAFADEVKQTLNLRLLTAGPGQAPKLVRYAGGGKLRALVRVSAVRIAINHLHSRSCESDTLRGSSPDVEDIEHRYIRREYGPLLAQAVEHAILALSRRQRTVLRLHLRGLTFERIGTVFGVHRATAARWHSGAQKTVADLVKRRLQEGLGGSEVGPLLQELRSAIDVSVDRLLASDGSQDAARSEA